MKDNPIRTFHIQGIAWSKKNDYVPISGQSHALNDIKVSVREEVEGWGDSCLFEMENTSKEDRQLKVFFLIEWLACAEDGVGVLSLTKDTFWNYSGKHVAITNIVSCAQSVKKTIYPLNLKGLKLWKKSLSNGSLYYYPITNGRNMMVYMLDFSFKPFEVKQGKVYAIVGAMEEEVSNLSDRIKNGLAFPREK
ncbi:MULTISPECIES: hypothetical protein [Bacillaceae]|uniref:hypothetical protein n=1 Tax=Bacillaceae TaxID=186817 RepID=UPI001C585BDB|nr:hypothetical protein [Rossellomorea sp. YZS02]MBW3114335.1 hypothetical protein [Bacillus sp. MCCB 382]MDX8341831.1 hypothetical protein [Rossellomorea sp. YZS02]